MTSLFSFLYHELQYYLFARQCKEEPLPLPENAPKFSFHVMQQHAARLQTDPQYAKEWKRKDAEFRWFMFFYNIKMSCKRK